jgi:hypothetical protein
MPRETRRHHQHPGSGEQFDLFRLPSSGSTRQPPAWEALPPQTRATLTELIMRLTLDHGQDRCAPGTREVRHES